MSVPRVIITRSRGHLYRRRVEYVYDSARKRTVPRILENLGPVKPIYRRPSASSTAETYPGTLLQFGLLATHLMNRTLTAEIARHLIEGMGAEVPPGTLHALGIRVALGENALPRVPPLALAALVSVAPQNWPKTAPKRWPASSDRKERGCGGETACCEWNSRPLSES